MTKAVLAGSFDPLTNGHLDLIERSLKFCSKLIIAIGLNSTKKTLFTENERINIIVLSLEKHFNESIHNKISVTSFDGLLINYALESESNLLIRGIRSVSDFEYEINLAGINKALAPQIETVFLPTDSKLSIVSSSMVKEIARYGGDVKSFVPEVVAEALLAKLKNNSNNSNSRWH